MYFTKKNQHFQRLAQVSINYTSDITILCRVVDNFGDVGFAYRLARALKNLQKNHFKEKTNLRLVIDDLHSFSLLAQNTYPMPLSSHCPLLFNL